VTSINVYDQNWLRLFCAEVTSIEIMPLDMSPMSSWHNLHEVHVIMRSSENLWNQDTAWVLARNRLNIHVDGNDFSHVFRDAIVKNYETIYQMDDEILSMGMCFVCTNDPEYSMDNARGILGRSYKRNWGKNGF
jgi:hypothetical protein